MLGLLLSIWRSRHCCAQNDASVCSNVGFCPTGGGRLLECPAIVRFQMARSPIRSWVAPRELIEDKD